MWNKDYNNIYQIHQILPFLIKYNNKFPLLEHTKSKYKF